MSLRSWLGEETVNNKFYLYHKEQIAEARVTFQSSL